MRILLAVLLATAPLLASAQNAPFCVVSGIGRSCMYYNYPACQGAANSIQGMCVANQSQQSPTPAIQNSDFAGSFQRGYAEGQRRKIEREEHEARLALLKAQTEAVQARTQPAGLMLPVFLCRSTERLYYSDSDPGGCAFMGSLPAPSQPPTTP